MCYHPLSVEMPEHASPSDREHRTEQFTLEHGSENTSRQAVELAPGCLYSEKRSVRRIPDGN